MPGAISDGNFIPALIVSQVITSLLPAHPLNIPAVPEPETYAMLLLGLGAIGLVKRRKTIIKQS